MGLLSKSKVNNRQELFRNRISRPAEQGQGSALTINDQPVENRRQLVVGKAPHAARKSARRGACLGGPRRSTEASPQDALRQRQRAADRGAKGELIRELEIRALRLPLRRSLP